MSASSDQCRDDPSSGVKAGDARLVMWRSWLALLSFRPVVFAASEARSLASLLVESTGLSTSHLMTRGLHVQSQRRLEKVRWAMERATQKRLIDAGFSEGEAEDYLRCCPETPLASLAFQLGNEAIGHLDLAVGFCAVLDAHAMALIDAIEREDLVAYKQRLVLLLEDDQLLWTSIASASHLAAATSELSAATDWSEVVQQSEKSVHDVVFSILVAIDVDWGAKFFRSLEPQPTLVWLFPRLHPDFDRDNSRELKRDLVCRPAKLLLELLWGVAQRGASPSESWPSAEPGASRLAADIALADVSDQKIRHWTSGSRPLRYSQAHDVWRSLTANLLSGLEWPSPSPWLVFGLWMDRQMVKRPEGSARSQTVVIPPADDYVRVWHALRAKWAASLPEAGRKPWPEWITARAHSPGLNP